MHDAVYAISSDLAHSTVSAKILKDRPYQIALNPKCNWHQCISMMHQCKFDV